MCSGCSFGRWADKWPCIITQTRIRPWPIQSTWVACDRLLSRRLINYVIASFVLIARHALLSSLLPAFTATTSRPTMHPPTIPRHPRVRRCIRPPQCQSQIREKPLSVWFHKSRHLPIPRRRLAFSFPPAASRSHSWRIINFHGFFTCCDESKLSSGGTVL